MRTSRWIVLLAFPVILFTAACLLSDPSPTINVDCDVQDLIDQMDWANGDPRPITLVLDEECLYELTTVDNLIGRNGNTTGESGANGLPAIQGDLTIIGNDALIRRSYAAGTPDFRIFFVASSGNLTIDNLLVENGSSTYGGGALFIDEGIVTLIGSELYYHHSDFSGGAIYNEFGDLTLQNTSLLGNDANAGGGLFNANGTVLIEAFSFVTQNEADLDGGGIYNHGSLTIDGSRVLNNDAGRHGGGIYTHYASASLDVVDSFFEDNTALNSLGGAIAASDTNVSIAGSFFARNEALTGGAVSLMDNVVSIQNSTFSDNQSIQAGGAIYTSGAEATIDGSNFSNNTGTVGGAIVHIGISNLMTITSSTFSGNTANLSSGGAVRNSALMHVEGCTFESNIAQSAGGGFHNTTNAEAVILNSTFSGNVGLNGSGGIYNEDVMEVVNTTLTLNEGLSAAAIWSYYTGSISLKNIIIADNISSFPCDMSNVTVEGVFVDTTGTCSGFTTDADPMLVPLADNGGPTQTHALPPDSPVIDLATDCGDLHGAMVSVDQRGVSRPYPAGGNCDPGAYEFDSTLAPPPAEPTTSAGFLPSLCAPQNTTCREGPDQRFAAAGYLLEGECADILGRSENLQWYVITNPDRDGECFVAGYLVEVHGPTDDLPVVIGPSLPETNETPESGCLVQERRGDEPVCVVPCPADADPGTPCIP